MEQRCPSFKSWVYSNIGETVTSALVCDGDFVTLIPGLWARCAGGSAIGSGQSWRRSRDTRLLEVQGTSGAQTLPAGRLG